MLSVVGAIMGTFAIGIVAAIDEPSTLGEHWLVGNAFQASTMLYVEQLAVTNIFCCNAMSAADFDF